MENLNSTIVCAPSDTAFRNAVEEYSRSIRNMSGMQEVVQSGLKVLHKLPFGESASLFVLNEDTYEFDYRAAYPFEAKEASVGLFSYMVDNGAIGSSVESTNPYFYYKNGNVRSTHSSIVFPLITANNIIGLAIVLLSDKPDKIGEDTIKTADLFTGMFAGNLYNASLLLELDRTKSFLEQKVAARTLSLSQSRRELQLIVDSVQAGIMIVDAETNHILNSNHIAENMTGLTQDKLLGRSAADFFKKSNEEADSFDKNVKFSRNFESVLLDKDNREIAIQRTFSNIMIGGQRVRLESFFDISDRKRAELQLKENNEILDLKVRERTEELQILVHKLKSEVAERYRAELEIRKMLEKEQELNELKSRFVSMVSHEFRTPLTIISSSAQILHRYIDKLTFENKKENLLRILKTVDYMKDLLENVLFIGKTDSQAVSFAPAYVSPSELTRTIIKEFELGLQHGRVINFKSNIRREPVRLDENLLRHILNNLLSNAVKYSEDNTEIDVTVDQDEFGTVFSVLDRGIGIPDEDKERIFDVFHRAKNVGAISGTGLGMAIVLRSIELHSGKIRMKSEVGKGSEFTVSIPFSDHINAE